MIKNRSEFIEYMNIKFGRDNCNDPTHPIWYFEHKIGCHFEIFYNDGNFYNMNDITAVCFYSDTTNNEEWWGFKTKDDLTLWLMLQ